MRAAGAALAGLGLLALTPALAAAHPHMFFDAEATLIIDAAGRLSALRLTYAADELNSLTILTDLGVNPDGPLSPEDSDTIDDAFIGGLAEFGWYAALSQGEKRIAFADPVGEGARLDGEILSASFVLPLAEPIAPAAAAPLLLQLYDPTYFTDVGLKSAPTLGGPGARACQIDWRKFEPDAEALAAQRLLALVPADQTPEEAEVGRRFADHIYLRCGVGEG